MNSTDGVKREIRRLRDKLIERDSRSSAPPLDADGLPMWDGPGLSMEGYERACGDVPAADLSDEELATRNRLAPYAEVFQRLERDANEEAGT